jgi:hypothetical protein
MHGLIDGCEHVGGVDLVGRRRHVHKVPHVVAEELDLVDRLIRPGVAEFGRSIRRQEKHRHPVRGGLYDGGLSVGDGRSGGRDPCGRGVVSASIPQRGKGRSSLVDVQDHLHVRVPGRRHCERRGSRARSHEKRRHPRSGQFFNQETCPQIRGIRGIERRVRAVGHR